jgi:hypothetical protein
LLCKISRLSQKRRRASTGASARRVHTGITGHEVSQNTGGKQTPEM